MDLLSLPWWLLPVVLFTVPVLVALGVNRWRFHRTGISQHLVLGLFVGTCWIAALIVILQQLR